MHHIVNATLRLAQAQHIANRLGLLPGTHLGQRLALRRPRWNTEKAQLIVHRIRKLHV
jgi:hypothetical protein